MNLLTVDLLADDILVMIGCIFFTKIGRNLLVCIEIFSVFLEIKHELSVLRKFWRYVHDVLRSGGISSLDLHITNNMEPKAS